MPETVQRLGADYNSAVAGLADELTLLNVVRAHEGLPLHYTSFGRLTGSFTVRGSGGLNAQIRTAAPTDLQSRTTTIASTGATIADAISRSVVSGGTVLTPSVGLEVSTGPSFDISVLDNQEFYQGILSPIPVSVINSLLLGGYDSQILLALLAARIELRLKDETEGIAAKKGDLLLNLQNTGSGTPDDAFSRVIACFELTGDAVRPPATILAPLSRITRGQGGQRHLTLQEAALLDGRALDLSAAMPRDPRNDPTVNLVRPSSQQQVARLAISPTCTDLRRRAGDHDVVIPPSPPAEPTYVGAGKILLPTANRRGARYVEADVSVTLRSPEAVIQFLGRCLRPEGRGLLTCRIGLQTLLALTEGDATEGSPSTRLEGRLYSIPEGEYRRQSLSVISLIERLINLQKKSNDRPVTVPVQIVP